MLRHLMKLVWKRKARNLMLSLEILLAFVLVFGIAAFAVHSYQLVQLPTGFDYEDVWSIEMRSANGSMNNFDAAAYDNLKRTLEAMPAVRLVAFAGSTPYTFSTMSNRFTLPGGAQVKTDMVKASDDMLAVLGMQIEQGRWFDQTDNGSAAIPVVINRRMASTMFGTASAVGKTFDTADPGQPPELMKVVGLIDDFRKNGELMTPVNFTIMRVVPDSKDRVRTILLKLAPGTPRSFEAQLAAQLKAIDPDLSYEIAPLAVLRESAMKTRMIPLIILSIIAAFLLVMVGFGLFGVLWQNTTRRIPEIGLRRAVGASAGQIYRQIIAEQLLLSSTAMALGLLLLVQLPLTGALGDSLNWTVFVSAAALSMAVIYLLSLLCSVYPGWRASRLSPNEALHYE